MIEALNESIENSNKSTARNTEDILASLKDKLSDPGTAAKAQVWYPKAQMIQAISIETYNYIEEITKGKRWMNHMLQMIRLSNLANGGMKH